MMSQLVRYAPVITLVERTRPTRILEVGSGAQGLGKFLAQRFVGVDREFTDYTESPRRPSAWMLPARADALALPFGSESFDLVLALDVLEHVPRQARAGLVRECVRVARATVVLGFPSGTLAEAHDRELAGWLVEHGRSRPGWLAEHLAQPFPTTDEVVRWLGGMPVRVRVLDNDWLPAHRAVMRWEAGGRGARYSSLLSDLLAPTVWDRRAHRRITNLLRLAVEPLRPALRLLDRRPAYRAVLVLDKNAAPDAGVC